MLCLTRTVGDSILIGEDIEVKVLCFTEGTSGAVHVSLGISAPKDVLILRKELKLEDGEESA